MNIVIFEDFSYHFTIANEGELTSLRWLAERYDSAQLLFDCVGDPEFFPHKVNVPEHIAWNILDATLSDGANRGTVPCLAGRLGNEIHKMLQEVI